MHPLFESFHFGVIEGFFGEPWSPADRADYAAFLKDAGYRFYIYAPKADAHLRKRWREDWPKEAWSELEALRRRYREAGVLFGLGFTPYRLQTDYDAKAARELEDKMARLNELKPDLLAVLFDDVPGIRDDLAEVQCEIAHTAFAASDAEGFLFCPTYYADDPAFERTLGPMPNRYLEELGATLDRGVQIFWTGPAIRAKDYPEPRLADVTLKLGRKPFLWDNYPVNDGPKMCRHLHLRAFTGRRPHLNRTAAGLAANPMNEAQLSKIPLLTLREALNSGSYDPDAAFRRAAETLCGPELARALAEDLALFHDQGLDAIGPERRAALKAKYARFDGPFAREVVRWLDGAFEPDAEVMAEFMEYV